MRTAITLFQSASYQVDFFSAGPEHSEAVIVTFSERGNRDLTGYGFGSRFLLDHGFDCISVKGCVDHWYSDLPVEALKSVIAKALTYKFRFGYGSSMGAYAAIRYSGSLSLQRVLAFSPLYDINLPMDSRYKQDRAKILEGPMSKREFLAHQCTYMIAFDPKTDDFHHFKLYSEIAKGINLIPIQVPHAGHPVGHTLNHVGYLKTMCVTALNPHKSALDIQIPPQRVLRYSSNYLLNLSNYLIDRKRIQLAEYVVSRLMDMKPESGESHLAMSRLALARGNLDDAIRAAERAAAAEPTKKQFAAFAQHLRQSSNSKKNLEGQ